MRELVERLCSDACAGRQAGSPGGERARGIVMDALREAGLDPWTQEVPRCRGANVLARIDGDIDRWIIVAAHYDHLGVGSDGAIYRGADDNAASVAVLVQAAKALAAKRPGGRGVIIAAFDAEEPPYYATDGMGSQHFTRNPTVPLDHVDMMVCMELVGHAIGSDDFPAAVRDSVFALGAERSEGTSALIDGIATAQQGIIVRRADAEIIPPLSDHLAFWERNVPFLLLTGGRTRHYHQPSDEPSTLSLSRLGSMAGWLERFVRASCVRNERPVAFVRDVRDDAATLASFLAVAETLAESSELAARGAEHARGLLRLCDARGRLPASHAEEPPGLIAMLEEALA